MPRYLALFALFLAVTPRQSQAASPLTLTAIHMVTPSVGWGITSHSVVRTVDGGVHWRTVLPSFGNGTQPLLPVLGAHDAQTAWAVAPYTPTPHSATGMGNSRVFATHDGGRTWSRSGLLQGYAVNVGIVTGSGLSAPDTRHLWLLTSSGAGMSQASWNIYRSTDGGVSWARISYGMPFSTTHHSTVPTCDCLAGIDFRTSRTGWLVGGFGVIPNYSVLYRSVDGGVTWHNQRFPLPRGYSRESAQTASPAFFGGVGLLPVLFSRPARFVLYISHNGGGTWSPTAPLRSSPGAPDAMALDPHHVWAWTGHTLVRTTDGGHTWHALPGLTLSGFPEIDFLTPTTGYILSYEVGTGNPSTFLRTTDGGVTWRVISPSLG